MTWKGNINKDCIKIANVISTRSEDLIVRHVETYNWFNYDLRSDLATPK